MPAWFEIEGDAEGIKAIQEKKGDQNNVDNHNQQSRG